MEKSLDRLIEHLLGEIAVCGPAGELARLSSSLWSLCAQSPARIPSEARLFEPGDGHYSSNGIEYSLRSVFVKRPSGSSMPFVLDSFCIAL
jgi:hypothetical protein